MYYYKTTIQYVGTNYAGFQWQNGMETVQSEFNRAISSIVEGKITTTAASRTDSGVHAFLQIVKVSSENPIQCSLFLEAFNKVLSPQIRCIEIEPCGGLFRPSLETTSKEYRYFFTNKIQVSIDERQFIANISNILDLDAMTRCTRALLGVHDFCNFYSRGSNVKSTARNIYVCELTVIDPRDIFHNSELFQIPKSTVSCYQLKIEANGFLKQMIRHIISALWMVGSGKISPDDFITLLNGTKNKRQLWKVASPNGLFLYRINLS
jgi:tRNA pseudouridine38-40 synthase